MDAVLAVMERQQVDVCGENGEYHTLVIDGPIFNQSLDLTGGNILQINDYATADIKLS